jgi:hypothetical protein
MDEEIDIEVGNDQFLAALNHARADLGAVEQPLNVWVTAEPPEPGFLDKAADYLMDKVVPEVGDMLAQKWNEGANEIAKALFGQSDGFVLYGHQMLEPTQQPEMSFDAMMYEASLRPMPEQENQLER